MVKTPYGIINMTSSSGGGGGPPGVGWERLYFKSPTSTDDTYGIVNTITEDASSTIINWNMGRLTIPSTDFRYPRGCCAFYWDVGEDYTDSKMIEMFYEFIGYDGATTSQCVWFGITYDNTWSNIDASLMGCRQLASPRTSSGTDYGGQIAAWIDSTNYPGSTVLTSAGWGPNYHMVIWQPVGYQNYQIWQQFGTTDLDYIGGSWRRITNNLNPPTSSTDTMYLYMGFSDDRGGSGTQDMEFRLWYRITDNYFTWS